MTVSEAVQMLQREGYRSIAVAVPASQCGLQKPDFVVALVSKGTELMVVQVDRFDVDECWVGDEKDHLLSGYGEFTAALFTGDPEEFDVTQHSERVPVKKGARD